ncbi:MAG: NAD(+) synthase [Bradymonadales bacterium]|jgi:NAD+ synthase (glutamine-hydrolysing)
MGAKYAVSSLNLSLGDWDSIRSLVIQSVEEAIAAEAEILVLPEFALCGVNLKDRFLRPRTFAHAREILNDIVAYSEKLTIIAGLPILFKDKAYNVAAVLHGGKICAYIPKRYPLQYLEEERYFARWPHSLICNVDEVPCGMIQYPVAEKPNLMVLVGNLEQYKHVKKGDILVQICAKPYYMSNYQRSLRQMLEFSKNHQISLLRAAMHGSDDGVTVYDGAAVMIENGKILSQGARFCFKKDAIVSFSDDGIHNCLDPSLAALAATHSFPHREADHEFAELELAICLALRDYLRRARIKKICIPLSGGRDSSMAAVLVARMMALENPELSAAELKDAMHKFLICLYMPSENSSPESYRAASTLAAELGAQFIEIPIDALCTQSKMAVAQGTGIHLDWSEPSHDLALQNLQARMRSTIAWSVANAHDALLLTNSNLSEAAVGYTTMDGDSSGGLSLIGNLPKTLITRWLHWAMVFHHLPSLQIVLSRPPSAELRPLAAQQNDESDLMPYPLLDAFIEALIVQKLAPYEVCTLCWPRLAEYCTDKRQYVAYLQKFIRMLCSSQWKRNRLASSFKLLSYDLDPKSGLRWPILQESFTSDFPSLDAWAAEDG